MTLQDILDQIAAGEIGIYDAVPLLQAIGIDHADVAGEVFEAASMAREGA